jgi:hypothetical protein
MREVDPHTEEDDSNPPQQALTPEIGAGEWATASCDPATVEFVQQAIEEQRRLEREGLIFP